MNVSDVRGPVAATPRRYEAAVILCRSACSSHAELLHHRRHVDDFPMFSLDAVLVERHDVDERTSMTFPVAGMPINSPS